ncbi:MAG: hypothetical protein CBB68_00430 [Rhodospirillaceae bacterium TMED8]|nr:MAG: hypothetical protein CBB68_00430 [Rhodospirillaceae bacterium TMED8]
MTIQRYQTNYKILEKSALQPWQQIPPAIAGDCMNRSQGMAARIKPASSGMTLTGQARTVFVMVGDNSAIHVAISMALPGEVLVIDARAHVDTAIWGGIMTRAAVHKGIAGVVIDGAVRDVAEIIELGFPVFCAGAVPAGPSKGFGGIIDGSVSCGGASVSSGDIILGDDDGVVVVPLLRQAALLAAAQEKLSNEQAINAETARGIMPSEHMGLPEPEVIN